jgi:transcriptional regulator with XRE-family HTH domain
MMTPETFRRWRKRHGMTQEQCATELGFKDRRQIINYEKGAVPIPRYIWLATVGFDSFVEQMKS